VEYEIDPDTGEEIIVVKPNPKPKEEIPEDPAPSDEAKRVREEVREAYGNLPEGTRAMKIVIKEEGKVIAEIPLVVDLQEPKEETKEGTKEEKKSGPSVFSFRLILLILVVLAISYFTLIKKGGGE